MKSWISLRNAMVIATFCVTGTLAAQERFGKTADQVNPKLVKLFGAGGFKGVASYGTGVLISPDGYILTTAGIMLDSQNLRGHLWDGRRYENLKVVAVEPELDIALVKIDTGKDNPIQGLPYYDLPKAAAAPQAQSGDWVLAFSNQFQIATGDEPMTVQKGVVASYSKLTGRRGIFEAPYSGDVYVVDAITNNPGAAGGVLTNRKGDLLGIVGKEIRNTQSDTWINYAVPVNAKVAIQDKDGKAVSRSIPEFVELAMKGRYEQVTKAKTVGGPQGFHGIILVPDVIDRTPPFVEDVLPNSPAAKAGLKADDLIVYVDGEQVPSVKFFKDVFSKIRPGSEVTLEIRRGDKLRTVKVKLEDLAKK